MNTPNKDSSLNCFSLVFIIIVLKPSKKTIAIAVNEMKEYQPAARKLPSTTQCCILKIIWPTTISRNDIATAKMD